MAEVTVVRDLDREPDAVWALLGDFGDIGWIPIADNVVVEGEGVGMRRLIPSGDGAPIAETLVAIDHDDRMLTYSIDNSPFPTTTYQAVCSVTDAGDGTRVEWNVTFEPIGDPAEAAAMIEAVYGMMAGWIADATATS